MKIILTALILFTGLNAFSQDEKLNKNLHIYHEQNTPDYQKNNCGVEIKFDPAIHQNQTTPLNLSAVDFKWPLEPDIDEGLILVNYIDHTSGSAITDYEGNDWSYNGHKGTDIALKDFRSMDRFYKVLAGAAGTVVQLSVNNFDRSGIDSNTLPANYILIKHSDGTYAAYYHLMKKSIVVKLGEYVTEGQLLGYVGSSGNSTDAHLHFEPGSFINNQWVPRDPWQGDYNHLASLWQSQKPYVGYRDFKLQDMSVYTSGQVGGNMHNFWGYIKERLITPVTISGYTDTLGFVLHLQGNNTGKQIRFEIRRSDGSLFDDTYTFASDQYRNSYFQWTPPFDPGIGTTGDWYVRVLYDNVEKGRCFFNVQLLTSNRPKMYPAAGKCFRRTTTTQRDTLRVRPVRTNMQYDLINAPPNVTLVNDSIITIGVFQNQFRYRDFKVIASIGGNTTLRDTMLYRLVDTTKINPAGNGVASLELSAKLEGFWNGLYMKEDTITAILRAPLYPFNFVDSARVCLSNQGNVIANFFNAQTNIYYYLIIKHRNSIETWSKTVMKFNDGYPISYDFTTSNTKAYGDNLKLKGTTEYCIYTGDVNQDGFINLTDIISVYNASSAFTTGYKLTDLNGDMETDLTDIVIVSNNSNSFVQKRRP